MPADKNSNITNHIADTNRENLSTSNTNRHWQIRYFAAAVTAVITVIYFMIGFNVVSVLDTSSDQIFGIFAGLAYGLGAILLLAFDRRVIWIVGVVFQVFVIFMYFNLASQRSPAFEVWGIVLRVAQFILLIGLVYLSIRSPQPTSTPSQSQA